VCGRSSERKLETTRHSVAAGVDHGIPLNYNPPEVSELGYNTPPARRCQKPSDKFELGLVGRDRRARRILERALRTARRSVPTIYEMASISFVFGWQAKV